MDDVVVAVVEDFVMVTQRHPDHHALAGLSNGEDPTARVLRSAEQPATMGVDTEGNLSPAIVTQQST
jgi:hypothetical protein